MTDLRTDPIYKKASLLKREREKNLVMILTKKKKHVGLLMKELLAAFSIQIYGFISVNKDDNILRSEPHHKKKHLKKQITIEKQHFQFKIVN